MVKVLVPTPLRSCTNGQSEVVVEADTVADSLASLMRDYPRLKPQLYDDSGRLRSFVNLFLNDEDIRMIDGQDSPVAPGDTIEILPAIAGGSDEPRDFASWRKELEGDIAPVTPGEIAQGDGRAPFLLLDVRAADEWATGHLPQAKHLDRGFLEIKIETLAPDRNQPIVCYCESGTRSLFAASTLTAMGYRNVRNLQGGIQRWRAEGREVVKPETLSSAQQRRYQRHLSIPELGIPGQQALGRSSVLVIGAGGLGCPVALYLAAAGIGRVGIVDDDVVDESNLQRQILYTPDMIGTSKVQCAKAVLSEFNPFVTIDAIRERLDMARALDLFERYDLIVDGTDNFRTRYVINDAAIACGKAVVHGAIYRFNGQVSVFGVEGGPCYRCFSPEAPPPELAPSCAEGGVLGVLPGTIGLVMATEAIKLLLGLGRPLSGRLIHYDALEGRFRELSFKRRPDCPSCGDGQAIARRAGAVASVTG